MHLHQTIGLCLLALVSGSRRNILASQLISEPQVVEPQFVEQCADTGAMDPLDEGVRAAWKNGLGALGSRVLNWGKNQVSNVSSGCYCPNERAQPMPGRWAPSDPSVCLSEHGWVAWKCYCPSLFRDYLVSWGEGEDGPGIFRKMASTADDATSPCESECGAKSLGRGYPVAEVDGRQTRTNKNIDIAWRIGFNSKATKLPPNVCAGKCFKPPDGKYCKNTGRATNRIARIEEGRSDKCCVEFFDCVQDQDGDWEKPGMAKAIHHDALVDILEHAAFPWKFDSSESEAAWNMRFGDFVAAILAMKRETYQAALPEGDVRDPSAWREDEFLSIFFGTGEPPRVVKIDVPREFGEGSMAFVDRPVGAGPGTRMEALAQLVATILSGILTNVPDESKQFLVASWDEEAQTLIVTLPVPMQGNIASSSKVPFKLHASEKLEFRFKDHAGFAEVDIEGLWVGPLQGIERLITEPTFRRKLRELVDAGLGSTMPNDSSLDAQLDDLARHCDTVYKDLAKGPWKKSTATGGPEEKLAEWLADVWSLMGSMMVKPFLDPLDFPNLVMAVSSAMPYEIAKLRVISHPTTGKLQVLAKRRAIKKHIQEIPPISGSEYDALRALGDRRGYVTMALPKSGDSGKTGRETALYLSKGQSALSWLAMFACDEDFPGFAGFATNLGKSGNMRYPDPTSEPKGGDHDLLLRMLTLCNDEPCTGSRKGRTHWSLEAEGFRSPAEAPDLAADYTE